MIGQSHKRILRNTSAGGQADGHPELRRELVRMILSPQLAVADSGEPSNFPGERQATSQTKLAVVTARNTKNIVLAEKLIKGHI
jgi:hypothetical protein